MQITLNLDDDLSRTARDIAAGTGRSLQDVIEDALRLAYKAQRPQDAPPKNSLAPKSLRVPAQA